jgi:hypothetical protein
MTIPISHRFMTALPYRVLNPQVTPIAQIIKYEKMENGKWTMWKNGKWKMD